MGMERKAAVIMGALLAGCAMTPERAARMPLPQLCYKAAHGDANERAWATEALHHRGNYRCSEEDVAMERQRMAREREAGADIAAGIAAYGAIQAPIPAGVGYLQRQWVQGASRFCQYNRLGNPVIITVQSYEVCPVAIP